MKKIITLLLVFVLFLSSCSIDWNGEKDKKIVELEKEVTLLKKDKENDIFKKKQECLKYKDEMLKFAQNYHSDVFELDEIFYSPINKSCNFIAKEGVGKRLLFDYLNNIVIGGEGFYDRCDKIDDEKLKNNCMDLEKSNDTKYEKKIDELKGE